MTCPLCHGAGTVFDDGYGFAVPKPRPCICKAQENAGGAAGGGEVMGERHSEHVRDQHDWYVEPAWVADDLFERVNFGGSIYDPCCGMGTIIHAARRVHIIATGCDLVDRATFGAGERDYLQDGRIRDNIVTNPPYGRAHEMALHALECTRFGGRIAFLTQLKFLASQRRFPLWDQVERVIIYSRRPSMPPGELLMEKGEACRGGGSIDFCWIVWNVGHEGPATIEWSLGPETSTGAAR